MISDTKGPIACSGLKAFFLRSIRGWIIAVLFGGAGLFVARFFSLSKLAAAGLTLGLFGFAGGLSITWLLQTAGAKIPRRQVLLLAATWAVCSIGGALPLFFTLGTRLQMAIRTFYSFAIFGAGAGLITARGLRSLFPPFAPNDIIPATLIWSFSFSLAAVGVDAAGEWLRLLLPSPLTESLAIVSMAVILGLGSGSAIQQFFISAPGGELALQIAKPAADHDQRMRNLWILIILCIPFYLNDFSNIYIKDWRWWLLIDYTGVKLFPFLVIVYLIRSRILNLRDFMGMERQSPLSFVSVVAIAVLAAFFIDQNGAFLLKKLFRNVPLGTIPDIPDPRWRWIDLSAGLIMVGIFEEVVFRGYFFTFLRQYTARPSVIIFFSSVAFGLIHWSGGLHQIILASAAGAVFMLIYLHTYSLPAVILSHFIINFVDFAGILPLSLFSFFPTPPIR